MGKNWIHKTHTFELLCHHRLISKTLTHEQNLETFGKCMGTHGHGHNYRLKITFRYPYCPDNPLFDQDLCADIERLIIKPFSHTSLNEVFKEMGIRNPITTGEQIIEVFAQVLREDEVCQWLDSMELVETRRNSFFWYFHPPVERMPLSS
ncbi:hypothetical protein HOF92_15505 [bacterium]|jgi:6-pyruvoyltetrahydropterin/6-carboxytetrahydropterin synthase|nr:hypothetical protein [bacterium]